MQNVNSFSMDTCLLINLIIKPEISTHQRHCVPLHAGSILLLRHMQRNKGREREMKKQLPLEARSDVVLPAPRYVAVITQEHK
jgi:hypothetical protein